MMRSAPRAPLRCRARAPLALATLTWVVFALTACGDDPFKIRWTIQPDTVLLYSLARPELNLLSGFSFINRIPVRIEAPNATGTWDVALDTRDGGLVLLPPGALGVESRARIATLPGAVFDEVIEAPADTMLYTADQPVQVSMGTVYIVRTNQYVGSFGTRCVNYGKLEPVAIDAVVGTLSFVFDASPVCNDRKLIPPD
jgi:hypothetical protein